MEERVPGVHSRGCGLSLLSGKDGCLRSQVGKQSGTSGKKKLRRRGEGVSQIPNNAQREETKNSAGYEGGNAPLGEKESKRLMKRKSLGKGGRRIKWGKIRVNKRERGRECEANHSS